MMFMVRAPPGEGGPAPRNSVRRIRAHQQAVRSLAWARDGRLATGSDDGTAKIWVLDNKFLETHACDYLYRSLTREEWATYVGGENYRPACAAKEQR